MALPLSGSTLCSGRSTWPQVSGRAANAPSTCCSAVSADAGSGGRGDLLVDDGRLVASPRIEMAVRHPRNGLVPFALGGEPVEFVPVAVDESRERVARPKPHADAVGAGSQIGRAHV